jgi:hypothetical protein
MIRTMKYNFLKHKTTMDAFWNWLLKRRGCNFGQRFLRPLTLTGPPLLILEVIESGVLKEPQLALLFLVFALPGTLLFVPIETAFEHLISRSNRP